MFPWLGWGIPAAAAPTVGGVDGLQELALTRPGELAPIPATGRTFGVRVSWKGGAE